MRIKRKTSKRVNSEVVKNLETQSHINVICSVTKNLIMTLHNEGILNWDATEELNNRFGLENF
ncbi:MAG: hypothetical protein HYX61_05330 [Gammaproteobacteria bacterium]|jgi:hypothetical protein|nr:hypothetical protein [Gammaproteobacteria bacterium]